MMGLKLGLKGVWLATGGLGLELKWGLVSNRYW